MGTGPDGPAHLEDGLDLAGLQGHRWIERIIRPQLQRPHMTTYLLLKDPLHHKSLIDLVRADDVDVAVPGILKRSRQEQISSSPS